MLKLKLQYPFSLSCIGKGNGNPLQCSCLENPRDGGAWWAAVYGVTLKLMSIESVMPSNHLILCCPLLLLPSVFLSIRIFSSESVLHMGWTKDWNFSFSISPSKEYSGLISFRMDWLDLLAVQGTLKSLFQHHRSKPSILWSFSFISPSNEYPGLISFRMDWLDLLAVQGTLKSLIQHHSSKASIIGSAFFIVQLSHPYTTTGKTIAVTRWTFVGKVMSLLFNMLSRLVITFLPRSKRRLISWLQSPSSWTIKKAEH